jgi:hypothetical protein
MMRERKEGEKKRIAEYEKNGGWLGFFYPCELSGAKSNGRRHRPALPSLP